MLIWQSTTFGYISWELRWQDYYEILQVHPKASQAVISRAYRTLAQTYHADAGGSNEAMVNLNLAHEVLSDPTRRSRYDVAYQGRQSAGRQGPTAQSVSATPEEFIATCLREAGLKFIPLGNVFLLPFSAEAQANITVQLHVIENGELVVISAPLPQVKFTDRKALHNLLRATHILDTYKLSCDKDKDFTITAEIPYALVTSEVLDSFVRGCVTLADVQLEAYRNFDQLQRIVVRIRSKSTLVGLLQFLVAEGSPNQAQRMLPEICHANDITCRRLDANNFVLQAASLPMPVHALCRSAGLSLMVPTGMKPETKQAEFFTELARMNMTMNICKVALDSDDEVAFLYELPSLSEQVLVKAMERIRIYILGGGLKLIVATQDSKKKGIRKLLSL